jgi:glycosyltransferase involved in cell wall biosynthesis
MNSILLTNSGINKTSGGGVVSYNLMEALRESTDLKYIMCNQKQPDNKINNTKCYTINPNDWGYQFNPDKNMYFFPTPFFQDYMAFHLLDKATKIDLVLEYGCPFGLVTEEIKREWNSIVISDLPPHDINLSKQEHELHGVNYPYPHLTNKELWGLYSRALRFSNLVITHSKKSAEYIKEKAKLKQSPFVIPHGCQIPTEIPPYPSTFVPSYLGAMGLDKGIVYLVKAWSDIKSDLTLLIGGAESTSFKVHDNIKHRFKTVGRVENITDFYKQVSVGVYPSITEGFGIPCLETMAHGRPVIVSEGAGVSEIVESGKNGFVVPIRDVDAIKKYLQIFIDNPEQIKKMGLEARRTAENYSWQIIKQKYKDLFKKFSDRSEELKSSKLTIS